MSRGIRTLTSRTSLSCPEPMTSFRFWSRSAGSGGGRTPNRGGSVAAATASSGTDLASRDCSPRSSGGRTRPPARPTGARSRRTTSPRSTGERRKAGSPIRPTRPGSSAGSSARATTTRATPSPTNTRQRTQQESISPGWRRCSDLGRKHHARGACRAGVRGERQDRACPGQLRYRWYRSGRCCEVLGEGHEPKRGDHQLPLECHR